MGVHLTREAGAYALTVDELRSFLDEADRVGIPGDTELSVVTKWSGRRIGQIATAFDKKNITRKGKS